jgi:hypothetical protein
VEAAVAGILVLAAALVAHRKAGHRRIRAVVWNGTHDCEAWAALRAVEERVAVAAVRRIEELAQAVVAGGDVRWHEGACTRGPARHDPEASFAARGHGLGSHGGDVGERRGFCAERAHERLELRRLAFHLDHDALTVVQDEAGQPVPTGESIHERPEADALDDALDTEAAALPRDHDRSLPKS